MDDRTRYIDGLRELAAWLEENPDVEAPVGLRVLLPLTTNGAVEEFAAKLGQTVDYDDEGNASTTREFGPLQHHAYGYVDFAASCDALDERSARRWAARQGLEIREAEPSMTASTTGGMS
ncbi:hypothetical protein CG740_23405 [Streptomyces sp. CB01201]|uniref:hypothetical protein n=1 Tax=Streptomyces sp. CB01201 TaxID=2020324 RepID=UPI000C27371E|nr:hypothetical protein [Streptomyces sp. CB01201]PJN00853.1 hypothetical protein CG740_23405 [Streptomyces sp. CB01201]